MKLAIHDQICWVKSGFSFSLWKSIQADHKCCNCLRMCFFLLLLSLHSKFHRLNSFRSTTNCYCELANNEQPYKINHIIRTIAIIRIRIIIILKLNYSPLCKIIFSQCVSVWECVRTKLWSIGILIIQLQFHIIVPRVSSNSKFLLHFCPAWISLEITNE